LIVRIHGSHYREGHLVGRNSDSAVSHYQLVIRLVVDDTGEQWEMVQSHAGQVSR